MRSSLRFTMIVLVVSAALSKYLWGGGGLVASAALAGGRYLTPSETVEVLGNTLKVTYFNGTDTTETDAVYVGADTVGYLEGIHVTDYLQSGLATVVYSFSGNVINNPSYIAVEFPAEFAILETEQVYTVAGITASGSGISNDVYQAPQWVWTMAGARQVFEGRHDYGMHYRTELSYNFANGEQFDYIPVSWIHQGETSAFSQRLYFSYASAAQDGKYYIAIGVPYITASGDIDTVTGTTGTNPDGSINVDLSETNGLLGGIAGILADIKESLFGEPEEPAEPEEIETAPEMDYHKALDDAAEIVDDVPTITAAAGFWFAIYRRFTDALPLIGILVPLGAVLSLISYALWK